MKTVYLMRAGESLFNMLGKVQGWCDSPLTERGIEQALATKKYFADHNINLEVAYCSTAERASDTLELVTDLPYKRLKGLKEFSAGRFEAESHDLLPPPPFGDFFVSYGGDSAANFKERVANTIASLVQAETANTILIVSHGGVCRNFMRTWSHTSNVNYGGQLSNGGVLKFEYKNQQFMLREVINHESTRLQEG